MEEDDLLDEAVAEERRLIDVVGPAGVRRAAEEAVERQVGSAAGQKRRGEQLGVRVGGAVLLHEEVPVNGAGGEDEADVAEGVELGAQPLVELGRRVDEQAAAG